MEQTTELIRNAKVDVGTDSVVVSTEQYGTQRTVLFITNISTGGQSITISPADEAKAGEGIVLGVGGFYQDAIDSGYKPTNRQISAISSAAGGQVSVHERVLMRGV